MDGSAGAPHELSVDDLVRSRDISLTVRNSDHLCHVKATHLPSGIFSECDAQNFVTAKIQALDSLRSKLVENGSPPLR